MHVAIGRSPPCENFCQSLALARESSHVMYTFVAASCMQGTGRVSLGVEHVHNISSLVLCLSALFVRFRFPASSLYTSKLKFGYMITSKLMKLSRFCMAMDGEVHAADLF